MWAKDGYAIEYPLVFGAMRAAHTGNRALLAEQPAGAVQREAVVRELAALELPILSDEIYDGLLFDGARVISPLGITTDCFVFDGFSKRYAMTGFRLGYVIAPRACVRTLHTLQQNLHICASSSRSERRSRRSTRVRRTSTRMRATYERRRALLEGLASSASTSRRAPEGAFYCSRTRGTWAADSMQRRAATCSSAPTSRRAGPATSARSPKATCASATRRARPASQRGCSG